MRLPGYENALKYVCSRGAARWGSLQRFPDSLAGLKVVYFEGGGEEATGACRQTKIYHYTTDAICARGQTGTHALLTSRGGE